VPNDITKEFIKEMNKELGKNKGLTKVGGINITTGGDLNIASHVPFAIPSGLPLLELSIGKPGYPAGRVLEFFGFESSGKTTAALHAIAECQRLGGQVIYIDTEYTFDLTRPRAKKIGVDVDNLLLAEADSIEKVFDTIDAFLDKLEKEDWRFPSMIVVDSITGVESEGSSVKEIREEARVGQDARIIRKAMRRLTSRISTRKTCAIFINHAIANIGFGNPKTSAGGHALKFFASLRIDFTFLSQLVDGQKDDRHYKGQSIKIAIRKNKINSTDSPEFDVKNGVTGFDIYEGIMDGLIAIGLIESVNQQSWHYVPTGTTFMKKEWKALVDGMGGPSKVYDFFLQEAEKVGKITPYGSDTDTVISIQEEEEE